MPEPVLHDSLRKAAVSRVRLSGPLDDGRLMPHSFHNLAYRINHHFRPIMLYVMTAVFNQHQFALR